MKLSFGLYSKAAIFWLAVIALAAGGFFVLSNRGQRITAFDSSDEISEPGVFEGTAAISKDGRASFQGRDVSQALKSRPQFDEFQLKVFDEPGTSFSLAKIDVELPFPVDEPSLKPTAFLIHSFDPTVTVAKKPPTTVTFLARNVSADAILTIRLEFKRGLVSYPLPKRVTNFLVNAPLGFWIASALVLPGLTLGYLLWLLATQLGQMRMTRPTKPVRVMPQDLPPAVVGVLKRGSISARDVAATLVDLARRGYIDIFWRDGHFSFAKRKDFHFYRLDEVVALPQRGPAKTKGLRRYEEVLLSKILPPEGYRATEQDIVVRVGHRLFSPKMAEVFMAIYQLATDAGFFISNPGLVHRRIRRQGITLFIIGLIGFAISALAIPEPKFLLIFWIGMIAASLLVVELGNLVPLRTAKGQQALNDWLGFELHLKDPSLVSYTEINTGVFEQYLPYAIALGVEGAWIWRFRQHPFTAPKWFASTTANMTLEQFDRELFPILSWVASSLVAAKEPTVE